jgi:Ca2+-binding RTX toxin-like protein
VFDTRPGDQASAATITDFRPGEDIISLDNGVFGRLKDGALTSATFVVGAKALDSDDYVIYEAKSGALFYDPDGSGATAAIQVATLGNRAQLTAADFYVI